MLDMTFACRFVRVYAVVSPSALRIPPGICCVIGLLDKLAHDKTTHCHVSVASTRATHTLLYPVNCIAALTEHSETLSRYEASPALWPGMLQYAAELSQHLINKMTTVLRGTHVAALQPFLWLCLLTVTRRCVPVISRSARS